LRAKAVQEQGIAAHLQMSEDSMSTEKPHVYSESEIAAKLTESGLSGWYYEEGWLRRKYNTDGWPTTLMLVNAVGYLCEAAYHHADLNITWGKAWIKLKTHSAGGITDKDFALAKQIEAAVLWRPPADGPLTGTPNKWVQGGQPPSS
jgi:4a-hydroxytetrahydrobiopterin dehydratase